MFFNVILLKGQVLTKEVRSNFCKNAIINAYFGSGSLKSWIIISAQTVGYKTPVDIENAVRNLCTDIKLQDEILKRINSLGGDRNFKEQQFISIGMTGGNAKLLNDYLFLKYSMQKTTVKDDFDYNFITDTIAIDKKTVLQSFFPKSNLINDSLILRKEKWENISGGASIIDLKTSVVKEYSYYDDKEDQDKIKIILFSTNDDGIGFIDVSTMVNLNNKNYSTIGTSKRIIIEKRKQRELTFRTIGGKFVIEYLDEENKFKQEYYNILNFKLEKTIVKSLPNKIDDKKYLFSGTKTFCDEKKDWNYVVTIKENKIIIVSYPGQNNTFYKDKNKSKETINGIIKDGKIVTKDSSQYLESRFRFQNGSFYEINNEGGLNEYSECDK